MSSISCSRYAGTCFVWRCCKRNSFTFKVFFVQKLVHWLMVTTCGLHNHSCIYDGVWHLLQPNHRVRIFFLSAMSLRPLAQAHHHAFSLRHVISIKVLRFLLCDWIWLFCSYSLRVQSPGWREHTEKHGGTTCENWMLRMRNSSVAFLILTALVLKLTDTVDCRVLNSNFIIRGVVYEK